MEGEDGGRQQVVVMHTATFLATVISNKGLSYLCTANNVSWFRKKTENLCENEGFKPARGTVPCLLHRVVPV